MNKLHKLFSLRQTPQNEPIPGTSQLRNSAGGFAWGVNDWTRLDRFLILGTEGGTFYIAEKPLTVENAQAVINCIQEDGLRVVKQVVEVSQTGRAAKNDPALFVLALCTAVGDPAVKQAAFSALPQVARTGTHLFHFLAYVEAMRGWGRGLRKAVARWYTELPAEKLAYQAVKYQQRDGWSHRDALRLAHPKAPTEMHNQLFGWLTQGWGAIPAEPLAEKAHQMIWAFEKAKKATSEQEIIELVQTFGLPWEAIPTEWLASPAVWRALLPQLPLTALLRNLARLTTSGVLAVGQEETAAVAQRLTNRKALRQARIHPIAVLAALKTYAQGQGVRGSLKWVPIPAVVNALDEAFYLTFENVEPANKRVVLALDVSGSMGMGSVGGVVGLTPRVASAAMALVTAATEKNHHMVAFSHEMVPVTISPRQRLDDVINHTAHIPFGNTDCAKPMLWAMDNKVKADVFVIYTDSETWFGKIHPVQALQQYRQKMGIPAKLVVVGMVSNGFTIADPQDAGMLDVVGFGTDVPRVITDFMRD